MDGDELTEKMSKSLKKEFPEKWTAKNKYRKSCLTSSMLNKHKL